jgi:hypothetical protein
MDRDQILAGLRERILAQEVLVVLHDKYAHVMELTELVPLAFQVLRFKMLDAHRKSLRRGEYNQESVDDLPLADPGNDPMIQLDQKQRVDRLLAAMAQLRPLGLRYSFVVHGTNGQDQEVGAAAASRSIRPIFLTVEANQDAYVQIWKIVGSSTPQLLWPKNETGQSSLRIAAWQRQQIPLSRENRPLTLTAHLSRIPLAGC